MAYTCFLGIKTFCDGCMRCEPDEPRNCTDCKHYDSDTYTCPIMGKDFEEGGNDHSEAEDCGEYSEE